MSDSAESLAGRAADLSSLLDAFELGAESDAVEGVGAGSRAVVTDGGDRRATE